MISWAQVARPIVALSPMADMTDSPFCRIAKKFGWPVVFREMVSAEAVVRENLKTLKMVAFTESERPIIQQIFGHNPMVMARAAAMIEKKYAPNGIDINMGCPVYKIVSDFNGCSLMREPDKAAAIIREIRAAVSVPVSVKIRLGWSDPKDCLDFARVLEDAGAALITIHGRTRAQGYSGVSDWAMVGRARTRVSIPVLCNGDIYTPEKVFTALNISGCAGVLIARGALGCPWFYKWYEEIAATGARQTIFDLAARTRVMREHFGLHIAEYGERGAVTFRKHALWYLKGVEHMKDRREQMMQVKTTGDFMSACDELITERVPALHTNKPTPDF